MEYHLSFPKTFRYEVLHHGTRPKKVLYVLHGYGQLVKYFIRKFNELPEDVLIVAPEGMHRFYLEGSSGRVGASWMTREDRETDIKDNLAYLEELDRIVSQKFNVQERYLLGFSQGGATASRWEELGTVTFHGVIIWASVFPPDLSKQACNGSGNHYFIIGNQDPFFHSEQQDEICAFYEDKGYEIIRYDGSHDIVNEILTKIVRKMTR